MPGIPSADELRNEGYELKEMDALLLQKIEELTLYILEQNKQIEMLKQRLDRDNRTRKDKRIDN